LSYSVFIEIQKKEIREAKGKLKLDSDDPKIRARAGAIQQKQQEDVFVV
jgi:hypothetical protein